MWLTETEKERKLAELSQAASRGEVDEAISPLLKLINSRPGMVTVQSCSGHRGTFDGEAWRNVSDGHVWIRMTENVSSAFERVAHSLCAEASIIQVALVWGRYDSPDGNRPLWEVVFGGLSESATALGEAADTIARWTGALES